MPARGRKNLAFSDRNVLHSCYEYNYISPSIGWDHKTFRPPWSIGGDQRGSGDAYAHTRIGFEEES